MVRRLIIAVLAATLAACASAQRLDAAGDVHALLIAIRDSDQAAFDAHVDRPALKNDMMAKLGQRIDKRLSGWAAAEEKRTKADDGGAERCPETADAFARSAHGR